MMNNVLPNIIQAFASDGLAALNAIGPAVLGLAMGIYLLLRILRFFTREYFGKEFQIIYTPPKRVSSNFKFAITKLDRQIADPVGTESILAGGRALDGVNGHEWMQIASHLKGNNRSSYDDELEAKAHRLGFRLSGDEYAEPDDPEDEDDI